ncbi:MAG: GDP-L-fucose synthase [Beijerinckiaceae bacterium]|nr:GDP-L-fucose synthase [Beijerinckiaceae bacterium]
MPEPMFSLTGKRVYVAGHRGMVGQALVRALKARGVEPIIATRAEVDLENQAQTEAWFAKNRPQVVLLAAAHVGGILANNTYPRDFLYKNVMIAANVIEAAHRNGVEKLVNLGSSCIYPKFAEQPIREESLLTGSLEPTNEWYAIAKIAAIKLAQSYRRQFGADMISLMPCNLYGPGDNYHPENSHVLPALIRRFHEAKATGAKAVTLWGSGKPRREFLFVDDLAEGTLFATEHYSGEPHLNVGAGTDVTIAEVAALIAKVVGFGGTLEYDRSKPDGTPRKLMDVSKLAELGWRAETPLEEGIRLAYDDFLSGGGRNG